MINEIKQNFQKLAKDRLMIFVCGFVFLIGIIFFISMISGIQPADGLIYVRYTIFGLEKFHKGAWTFRIALALLGLFVATFHNLLIAKIYSVSGRKMAIFFAVMSVVMVIFAMNIIGRAIVEIPN